MKNIIFSIITLVAIAVVTISCNQSSNKNSDQQANDSTTIAATPELQSPIHNDTVATVTSTNDVQQTMTSLAAKVDAIYLPTDNTVASTASTIGEILQEAKVPAMGSDAAVIDATLFTYGVDYHAIGVQAGELAVKILKGDKPADLPVEKPNTAAVTVNEEMATALGFDAETIKALEK